MACCSTLRDRRSLRQGCYALSPALRRGRSSEERRKRPFFSSPPEGFVLAFSALIWPVRWQGSRRMVVRSGAEGVRAQCLSVGAFLLAMRFCKPKQCSTWNKRLRKYSWSFSPNRCTKGFFSIHVFPDLPSSRCPSIFVVAPKSGRQCQTCRKAPTLKWIGGRSRCRAENAGRPSRSSTRLTVSRRSSDGRVRIAARAARSIIWSWRAT